MVGQAKTCCVFLQYREGQRITKIASNLKSQIIGSYSAMKVFVFELAIQKIFWQVVLYSQKHAIFA
jgi:hypothetical protein